MPKRLFALFALLGISYFSYAQILPKEGSVLNYRLVAFSQYSTAQSGSCAIQIALGNHPTDTAFIKNIIKTTVCKAGRAIIELPYFGRQYTWRVVAFKGHAIKSFSKLYHFDIASAGDLDPSILRVRVTESLAKYESAYFVLDGNKAMYDMKGNLVWFLPGNKAYEGEVIDLKISPSGTFTFLNGRQALEVNYQGDVLWKSPYDGKANGSNKEHYISEFTKLNNGHYMVLGNETLAAKTITSPDGNLVTLERIGKGLKNGADVQEIPFGKIIEYDAHGNVVWTWNSSDYFKGAYLPAFIADGRKNDANPIPNTRENSFFFDEKEKVIYVSFRDISRIVKIRYPDGVVLNEYGEQYKPGIPISGNGLYCNQHACKRSSVGCLFLFNNNGCNLGGLPKIKKLAEPERKNEPLKKIWEYTCSVEPGVPVLFPSGGSVSELPDQSLFVCMGSDYSKLFIVDTGKEVLWSALPERWLAEKNRWVPASQHRSSIIYDTKLLEQLVWSADAGIEKQPEKKR